ncbi:Acyl-CoA dehydrogenase [Oryzisolibacter propanilivorax]|uniref:Acyl-CoA dehydrogenase n=1 Tax=Oryzisolibacter propanilivorax TaxID=1527607 RepID=A0A1G9VLG1_9BURK|nr:acyl-CoA dehydrogenase family protein [Oryzisolibacter propanilivorax]SDM72940.1 Acyl-CoA dehydrogenase [Oryzisolibacter propanilivorax]
MNFELNEDRRMLADALGRYLSEQYPAEARNHAAYGPLGYSPETFATLAEIGAIGALVPEADGGFGGAGADIALVFQTLGRHLVAAPMLGALLVARALTEAGSPAQRAHLPGLMDGSLLAALAHDEPANHYELERVATSARREGDAWVLDGAKAVVPFGDQAQLLLISARTAGGVADAQGLSLFLVPGDAPGLATRGYGRIDGGHAAEVTLQGVRLGADALLGEEGQGLALLERIVGYGVLALSAESLGAMGRARDDTLEYLRTRRQFGVPIGSFQALQHRMADLLLEVEQARSAVTNAAAALDVADRTAREKALSAAKYTVGRVGTLVAEEAIQLHGGIGVTWELPLAHYAKRLVMIDHQLGDMDHHLARWMALG